MTEALMRVLRRLSWKERLLFFWSRVALIKAVLKAESDSALVHSQMDELIKRCRPVVASLNNDEYWGGLSDSIAALGETLEFLDEVYPDV